MKMRSCTYLYSSSWLPFICFWKPLDFSLLFNLETDLIYSKQYFNFQILSRHDFCDSFCSFLLWFYWIPFLPSSLCLLEITWTVMSLFTFYFSSCFQYKASLDMGEMRIWGLNICFPIVAFVCIWELQKKKTLWPQWWIYFLN